MPLATPWAVVRPGVAPRLLVATAMKRIAALPLLLGLPLLQGAQGDGCAAGSRSPAPDVTGWWDISYDDTIGVEVKVGGAVYTAELGAQGGAFTINHQGTPITFDLDCARPDVQCPSEVWPTQVHVDQRDLDRQHQMVVTLPQQRCDGPLAEPAPGTCGAGTDNPSCDPVCMGSISVASAQAFGVIGEDGSSFRLYLSAGVVTNGVNCALIGASVADADLTTTRSGGGWRATAMTSGLVTVGYAGACLWPGDPNHDGKVDALVAGATVTFTTGFTGARRP
jgi:hypothetical protein